MLSEIYSLYQSALNRQSAMDFDDLIWQASEVLRSDNESASVLRARWPYILEDEAQDSVPLQEHLLELITGEDGNWVRVGDPNQAITSSFTTAHPKQFNKFLDRADVETLPLPHSGRNAPVIFEAANMLVSWVCTDHPVPEVRRHAFRPQEILPTPEGDAQPNPPNSAATIKIRVYGQREREELPEVAQMASLYADQHDDHTLAILVPTHNLGYEFARKLDDIGADYDNQLKSANQVKEIAASLTAILAMLAAPLDKRAIADSFSALREIDHPAVMSDQVDSDRIRTILLSIYKPESFLFALGEEELYRSLPENVASEDEQLFLLRFSAFLRSLFLLRSLPFDDLILTLSDELYLSENGDSDRKHVIDLAIAYQLAGAARSWLDIHPDWRLPEISAQLANVARGSHSISVRTGDSLGFKPKPGRITLATQHGAKGMEWDAVFLVGIDGGWMPGDLDAPFYGIRMPSGGDPAAEAKAQLHLLMEGGSGLFEGRSATDSAHIEIICERLRLLYVGVTRARRYLHISRSRRKLEFDKEVETVPATVMGVLYRYIRNHEAANRTA
jgi:DNA helicase-2/ATP-dependent DNA helicase PcrA